MLDSDSAILDSDTFLSSLRFTPKHSPSTLTLTQTNSIWLTWWWQPSWILPSWIQPFYTKLWLKLIHSDSNSFILTQLDDGSHLEFCHLEIGYLEFSHLSFSSQSHSHLPRLVPTIRTKKPSLIHSDSTWWWQPSWILPCWIKKTSLIHSDSTWWWQSSWILPCWIQTPCFLLSDSLKNTLTPLWLWLKLIQSDSNSFILTQLDDGSHLQFYHIGFRHCHLGFRHLLIFSQIHSKTLSLHSDSWLKLIQSDSNLFILTQLDDGSHLEFCHVGFRHLLSDSLKNTLTPLWFFNQTNLIWFKLIHSDSIWWWQPSWILPCWIQTPCFLLSDSLKNTLPTLWLLTQSNSIWLKLIHSDSTWWWQPSWIQPS